jgi:hypothetical protein
MEPIPGMSTDRMITSEPEINIRVGVINGPR